MARWRYGLAAMALSVGILPGGAAAQTATTTTVAPFSDPACVLFECPPRPPAAFVAGDGGQIQADGSSFCWGVPGDGGLCADSHYQEPSQALAVQQREPLRLRFAIRNAPTFVAARPVIGAAGDVGDSIPVAGGNPSGFVADFPPGPTVLFIVTDWHQGDASYVVKLNVRAAPAPPSAPGPGAPGRPLFTG